MRKKLALLCGVATLGVLGFVGVANALGSVSVDHSSGLTDNQNIKASVSGMPLSGSGLVYAQQCSKNDTDPTFDRTIDCAYEASGYYDVTTGATVPGSATKGPIAFSVNNIDPINGGWSCVNPADTALANWAGTTVHTTCYVRAVPGSPSDTTQDTFTPISFASVIPPANTPEAPYTILLPVGAGVVLAGGYYISRRRKPLAA
jgi:hypothetical protein